MYIMPISYIPDVVRGCLPREVSDEEWAALKAMTPLKWAVYRDNGHVLATVGIRVPSLLEANAVVWTVLLHPEKTALADLRAAKEVVREILEQQPYRLYAETYSKTDRRFAEWCGFTPVEEKDDYTLLEGAA